MADAIDSSDESDFEGFTEEDVLLAEEKENQVNHELGELQERLNESDIDLSDVDSEGYESPDSDGDDPVLRQMNLDWSGNLQNVNFDEFTENSGVTHGLEKDARPIEYFKKFMPDSLFSDIATETNRYAQQKGPDPRWTPTSASEVKAFIALNIIMGVRRLPRIWNYWSTDERFSDPYVSSVMTKTRFIKLNQYIHLRDTSNVPARGQPGYDPLYKVRTLINTILPKLKDVYKPGKNLSVDEAMVGFKGRVHFRQYMPAKPTKWGIKIWQICESESGYCCGFDVYTGKKDGIRQHGLGYDVVWSLSEPYHNQNRHLYFDRFFSSVILAEHLELVQTYTCSTIIANRKGLPDVVKGKLKNRGDLVQVQKGNLLATSYKDKRQLTFLSTNCDPGVDETLNKPHVNVRYNKHMGGVDLFDQLASYYPVGRSGTKWWRYLLWYIVNLAVINSYIVYTKSDKRPPPPKGYDHLMFRMDVAEQLRDGFTSRKHRVGRKSKLCTKPIPLEQITHHELVKIDGRKKVCRECAFHNRKTPGKGRSVETTFPCSFCDVPLCKNGCFAAFHERNGAN